MTAHWPVLTMVASGSSVSELFSTRVIVPFDPVMTRTRWTWPKPPAPTPTRKSVGWTSVPESLIPPDADHVPVNGPMMTVSWIVTGTEVLAAAGPAAASVAPPASAAATVAAAICDLTLIRGSFMIALAPSLRWAVAVGPGRWSAVGGQDCPSSGSRLEDQCPGERVLAGGDVDGDVAGSAGTGEDPGAGLSVDPVGAGDLRAQGGHAVHRGRGKFEHAAVHDDACLRTVGGASGAAGRGRAVLDHSDDVGGGPESLDGPGPGEDQLDHPEARGDRDGAVGEGGLEHAVGGRAGRTAGGLGRSCRRRERTAEHDGGDAYHAEDPRPGRCLRAASQAQSLAVGGSSGAGRVTLDGRVHGGLLGRGWAWCRGCARTGGRGSGNRLAIRRTVA